MDCHLEGKISRVMRNKLSFLFVVVQVPFDAVRVTAINHISFTSWLGWGYYIISVVFLESDYYNYFMGIPIILHNLGCISCR